MRLLFIISIFLIISGLKVSAQISIPGNKFNLINKLDSSSAINFYTSIAEDTVDKVSFLNPMSQLTYNSEIPYSLNDGAIWKGQGVTFEFHFGAQLTKKNIQISVFPNLLLSQNGTFQLAPWNAQINRYNYQFTSSPDLSEKVGIDWVQRYGGRSFASLNLGQSAITWRRKALLVSVATQNYSLGPSVFNPIILSRQGSGFPHIRMGFKNAQINKVGRVEGFLIYGLLKGSRYYNEEFTDSNRYINGLFISYSPVFFRGLKLGFNKVLYKNLGYFRASDLVSTLYRFDNGTINGSTVGFNDTFDQLASLTIEWNFPQIDFRAYSEFAKDDFTDNNYFRMTLVEPEHARAYTIGFEKKLQLKRPGSYLNIVFEHTNLSRNSAFLWRPPATFYRHNINFHGYTHNGDLLGASLGPGGNGESIMVQLKGNDYLCFALLRRTESNRDYFIANVSDFNRHHISYSGVLGLQKTLGNCEFFGTIAFVQELNRYYIFKNDLLNISTSLGIKLLVE